MRGTKKCGFLRGILTGFALVSLTSTPQRLCVCVGAIAIVVAIPVVVGFVVAIAIVAIVATPILYCFPAAHCPLLRTPIFHGQQVS